MMRTHQSWKTSLSLSATEEEPSLQQEPAGPQSYPVRNRHPPNILCYDHLGNPSYHPNITLITPARTASVSAYSPWTFAAPSIPFAMSHYWVTPCHLPVSSFCTILCHQAFTSMCRQWLNRLNTTRSSGYRRPLRQLPFVFGLARHVALNNNGSFSRHDWSKHQ